MSKDKQLLNHPAVISYSFRSAAATQSSFIPNYPVHAWLMRYLPKALVNIILFDYWLAETTEAKRIQVKPVYPLDRISDQFLNTFPLRDEKDELLFPAALEGSEQGSLATLALEARMYKERGDHYNYSTRSYEYEPGTYELLKNALPPVLRSLRIPTVLDGIILSYLNFEQWKALLYPQGNCREKSYNYYFPWKYDDKHLQRTKLLIDREKYSPQEQQIAINKLIEVHLPPVLVNIVKSYMIFTEFNNEHKEAYLEEITHFIRKYMEMERKATNTIVNYVVLEGLLEAIAAIKKGAWFDEKQELKTIKTLPRLVSTLTAKNAFEYWIFFFAKQSFFTQGPSGYGPHTPNLTFFEHIIRHFGCLEQQEIMNLKRVCYMAKALVESMLISTAKAPQHNVFYLSQEVALSLYLHINNHLNLAHELMQKHKNGNIVKDLRGKPVGLHNRGVRPVLLEKALNVTGDKVRSIEFNQGSGFFIVPAEHKSGTRLLNYHKRSSILNVLYGYINQPKNSGVFATWIGTTKKTYEAEAKELINRLLETPQSSPSIYLIIAEIEKLLKFETIQDSAYQKALQKVKLQLTLEQQQNSISFS